MLKERLPYLNDNQLRAMAEYYTLLIQGNERMNLTAITDAMDAADKHFVDSLLALPHIPQGAICMDVGSGAGLPGIPLLIARPDIRVTFLDSLQKRIGFIKETLAALGLAADCIHMRAEDAGRAFQYREKFDIVLARAVAPLNVLLELTAPFLRTGGKGIAYKGKQYQEEMENAAHAAKELRCGLRAVTAPCAYGERALVFYEKNAPTPKRYPRKAGEPARMPL